MKRLDKVKFSEKLLSEANLDELFDELNSLIDGQF